MALQSRLACYLVEFRVACFALAEPMRKTALRRRYSRRRQPPSWICEGSFGDPVVIRSFQDASVLTSSPGKYTPSESVVAGWAEDEAHNALANYRLGASNDRWKSTAQFKEITWPNPNPSRAKTKFPATAWHNF